MRSVVVVAGVADHRYARRLEYQAINHRLGRDVAQRGNIMGLEAAADNSAFVMRGRNYGSLARSTRSDSRRNLATEMGYPQALPTPMATDNVAARATAYNPKFHDKMKHVERRHLFVRECIEMGKLTVPYVNTADNLADFFTKPLKPCEFFPMRDKIMNVTA